MLIRPHRKEAIDTLTAIAATLQYRAKKSDIWNRYRAKRLLTIDHILPRIYTMYYLWANPAFRNPAPDLSRK